jgi:hypothetical protein
VAVGADELALLQLREDDCTLPISHQIADASDLLVSREVIPMHDPHWEQLATVCARNARFQ